MSKSHLAYQIKTAHHLISPVSAHFEWLPIVKSIVNIRRCPFPPFSTFVHKLHKNRAQISPQVRCLLSPLSDAKLIVSKCVSGCVDRNINVNHYSAAAVRFQFAHYHHSDNTPDQTIIDLAWLYLFAKTKCTNCIIIDFTVDFHISKKQTLRLVPQTGFCLGLFKPVNSNTFNLLRQLLLLLIIDPYIT